jgi:poly(hydroxyalkanoate) granule-associated protein
MVKKLKSTGKTDDKQLANAVRTSAQQIWQAGLGAFAKAQEEGGKVFTKLVKEGTDLQKRTQKLAEDRVSDVTGTVTKMADGVSKQATGSWDKLEQVFEDRVSRALVSMGVPTQKDIQMLTQRVEELSKAVAELSGKKSSVADAPKVKKVTPPAAKTSTKVAGKAAPVAKAAAKTAAKTTSKPAAAPAKPAEPRKAPVRKAAPKKVVIAAGNADAASTGNE